jgi:lycopene beta-cyclase
MSGRDCDIAILDGGLAGGLIALALARLRPGLRQVPVERGERFGRGQFWFILAIDQTFWLGPAARAGAREGLMHPLTSYSLPDAVRLALCLSQQICRLPNVSGAVLAAASYEWARAHWARGSFYRMLTRMLFGAGVPQHRFRMLERFCCLPEPVIERLSTIHTSRTDALRIVAGRPAVALPGAMASLAGDGRPLAVPDCTA